MSPLHDVRNLEFSKNRLIIEIDGNKKIYALDKISKKLSEASDIEKTTYEISPSGYGIHWLLLDEDISIDGLLGIVHQPELEKLRA